MRDSFGGVFILKFLLIFIVFYMSFMAVAMNFARAFRIKNQVINIIEQNQYMGSVDSGVRTDIDTYLESVSYFVKDVACDGDLTERGVCITTLGEVENPYYKVTTYIKVEFPFLKINLVVPVSGETKIIHVS